MACCTCPITARLVIVVLQGLLQRGEAAAAGIVQAVLAATRKEAGSTLAALERADQRASDFLLLEALGIFFALSGIYHDGA